jgi:phosphoribosylformylglycinamidine cyclo-ligase
MPGFYDEGKYDIAGFAVGIIDRKRIIDGSRCRPGDRLLGLASSGVHSNGFSLIRKVIPDVNEDFEGRPIGSTLLEPTRIYVQAVLGLMQNVEIHGMAHITGGGFYENIPRMFASRPGLQAVVRRGSWPIPSIYRRIAEGAETGLESQLMFNTFNMGVGLVIALPETQADTAIACLKDAGVQAWSIGSVMEGEGIRFE